MAYNTVSILLDADGNPIPQLYNSLLNRYEPLEGSNGASKSELSNIEPIEQKLNGIAQSMERLVGTAIDEQIRKDNELERVTLYNEIETAYLNDEFKGEKGDQGIQGIQGERGEKGESGDGTGDMLKSEYDVEGTISTEKTIDSIISIPEDSREGIITLDIEGRMEGSLTCDVLKVISENAEGTEKMEALITEGLYEVNGVKNALKGEVFTKNIEHVLLSDELTWVFNGNLAGFKSIRTTSIMNPSTHHEVASSKLIKFNGNEVPHTGSALANTLVGPDLHMFRGDLGLYITISNEDSGWGQNYSPTIPEIKAYFNGWRMFISGELRVVPYNGTGTKAWFKISNEADSATQILPIGTYSEWTPYQFYYQLATPEIKKLNLSSLVAKGGGRVRIEGWKKHVIRKDDITFLGNVGSNMTVVAFNKQLSDAEGRETWNNQIVGPVNIDGWDQLIFKDNIRNVGTFYLSDTAPIKFCLPLNTTLKQAQRLLAGTVIYYKAKEGNYINPDWSIKVPITLLSHININSDKLSLMGSDILEQASKIKNIIPKVDINTTDIVKHYDEITSETISLSITDASTIATDTITYLGPFARKPRSATIMANIANKKAASWGEVAEGNVQFQMNFAGVTSVFGSAGNRAVLLMSDDSAANYIAGVVSIEADNRIKIVWAKNGTGVTGTAQIRVLARFHGGE